MKLGVCYYPEHWPRERWGKDARLMRAAGLDIVRLAEFAWALMEPVEGHFEWGWLDDAIALLHDHGFELVLGTPTAAPPAWLTRKYPDILRIDADGRPRNHGTRRHYCVNSPRYRDFSRRVVQAMAEQYGHDQRISGWQIDNEFGGGRTARCYCDHCATAFRAWLRQRYGSIANLNAAWGATFWSQTYDSWSQIGVPDDTIDKPNPSHELDYFRFASDSFVRYQQEQVNILRREAPDHWITHNFMGLFRDLDQFDLARPLDFITWDNYPTGNLDRWGPRLYSGPAGGAPAQSHAYDTGDPAVTGMAHALMRGLKRKPFWVMEQQCGHINWGKLNPGIRPGTPRLWTWHALAEGAEAVVYFRWRSTLFAQEQYHSGLLDHAGEPAVGYADLLAMTGDREQMAAVAAEPYEADVALLLSYDDLWALQLQPHRADYDYLGQLFLYYHGLQRLGLNVDILPFAADLSRYKLLLAPTLHVATAADAANLADCVAAGATLLLGVRSGFKTESNLVTDEPLPGPLRHLVGATVSRWQTLPASAALPVESALRDLGGTASFWVEFLEPTTAHSLARYPTGEAALTENAVGEGRVCYLGWYPDAAQATALLRHLARRAGVATLDELPPGVVAVRRGSHLLLLNFTDTAVAVRLDDKTLNVASREICVHAP